MPVTMRNSHSDDMKFWLEQQKKAARMLGRVRMPTIEEANHAYVRRVCRKLYGTSKYKPNGERYTPKERWWLFSDTTPVSEKDLNRHG